MKAIPLDKFPVVERELAAFGSPHRYWWGLPVFRLASACHPDEHSNAACGLYLFSPYLMHAFRAREDPSLRSDASIIRALGSTRCTHRRCQKLSQSPPLCNLVHRRSFLLAEAGDLSAEVIHIPSVQNLQGRMHIQESSG